MTMRYLIYLSIYLSIYLCRSIHQVAAPCKRARDEICYARHNLIYLFLNFSCSRLSWLPVSLRARVKYLLLWYSWWGLTSHAINRQEERAEDTGVLFTIVDTEGSRPAWEWRFGVRWQLAAWIMTGCPFLGCDVTHHQQLLVQTKHLMQS